MLVPDCHILDSALLNAMPKDKSSWSKLQQEWLNLIIISFTTRNQISFFQILAIKWEVKKQSYLLAL